MIMRRKYGAQVPAMGRSSVFGYLVTNGGYTPTSGEVYRPKLHSAGY